MEYQQQNQGGFDERKLVFQDEQISYQEAYLLNNVRIISDTEIIEMISTLLSEILEENDRKQSQCLTQFHGRSIPNISIKDYMKRILVNSKCSQECLVFALIYIDRITIRNEQFLINSYNIHRLLLTSIMLAAKFYDDSVIGGITNQELNQLEREFLHYLNFRLYISPVLYFKYRQRLIQASTMEIE